MTPPNCTSKRASSLRNENTNEKRARHQQSNQPTNHVSNDVSSACNSQSHEPLSVCDGLLTYSFLLPLVVECLNDGDVEARLLIVNKLMRNKMCKYSFKRSMYTVKEALKVIEASRDIVFSVTRLTSSNKLDELLRLNRLNNAPLKEVHYECGAQSSLDTIPRFITHLRLSINADMYRQLDTIPSSVTYLRIRTERDHFDVDMIPDTVTDIRWERHSDYVDDYTIPPTGVLCGPFPAALKYLCLLNHRLPFAAGVIPPSVTTLECNMQLLSVLDAGVIPNSVRTVNIEYSRDCVDCVPKSGVLSDWVTCLRIDTCLPVTFFPRWLPPRLTHFSLHVIYGAEEEDYTAIPAGMLPATLTHFQSVCSIELGTLPDGVTHVDLIDEIGDLCHGTFPHSVTHLKFGTHDSNITPGLIPSSVTHLEFASRSPDDMTPGTIPDSVTHLVLSWGLTPMIAPGIIPQSVTHLTFDIDFRQSITSRTLPRNLIHLLFGDHFNTPISGGIIPRTVRCLGLGRKFNQLILPGDIPPCVTLLAVGACYTHELDSSNLPISLTHLEIPRGYLKSNDKLWLPSSVTHISYKSKSNADRPEMSWNKWTIGDRFADVDIDMY